MKTLAALSLAAVLLFSCSQPETLSQSESLLLDATNARSQAAGYLRQAESAPNDKEAQLLRNQAQESESWAESLELRAADYAAEGL